MKIIIFNKTKVIIIISIKGIQFSKRTIILEKTNVQGIIRKKPDDERDETEEPDYKKRRNK